VRFSYLLLGLPFLFGTLVDAQISTESIAQSPANNWLTYHGDYSGKRFTPLREIDPHTVSALVPKWVKHFDTPSDLEVMPLLANGVMYVSSGNELYALDAVTGREIWHYRATGSRKRGVDQARPFSAIAFSSQLRTAI
jgi:glucose dehydrogenase